ncbi:unnamed protein product [Mytilus coruscus]|uniref:TRIM71 n=1 Tax=Mytilus coruscus TaxID=42192 RepID=A0A6J8EUB6_MYTCO|nr:unnamed protein product [Mytilus coruscus]
MQDFTVRQVIILGSDYQRKVILELDIKGNKLFSHVVRIRTDSRNIVYVIDRTVSQHNEKIVAVDRSGRFKFTYDGPKDYGIFNPQGITITPIDIIVVADISNDSLHVPNSKGELLGLQSIYKDIGIEYPTYLCIDSEGFLLIGCDNGRNEAYGKIHVVKMKDSLM